MTRYWEIEQIRQLVTPFLVAVPRFLGAMMIMPLFSSPAFPMMARLCVSAGLALPILPYARQAALSLRWEVLPLAMLGFKEMIVGVVIGFGLGIFFWMLENVGHLIDIQTGNNNSSIFNPASESTAGPFSLLLSQFGVGLFFAMGGGLFVAMAVYGSYRYWPIDATSFDAIALLRTFVVQKTDGLMQMTTRLAAVVLVVLLVAELALGAVNRYAQQLNVFSLAMPIKGALAILMLALFCIVLQDFLLERIGAMRHLENLLGPLIARPGS